MINDSGYDINRTYFGQINCSVEKGYLDNLRNGVVVLGDT